MYEGVVSAGSTSFHPEGIAVSTVFVYASVGLIDTPVMDGGVLPTVTGALVRGVPGS
jgi:hypothetical protein